MKLKTVLYISILIFLAKGAKTQDTLKICEVNYYISDSAYYSFYYFIKSDSLIYAGDVLRSANLYSYQNLDSANRFAFKHYPFVNLSMQSKLRKALDNCQYEIILQRNNHSYLYTFNSITISANDTLINSTIKDEPLNTFIENSKILLISDFTILNAWPEKTPQHLLDFFRSKHNIFYVLLKSGGGMYHELKWLK